MEQRTKPNQPIKKSMDIPASNIMPMGNFSSVPSVPSTAGLQDELKPSSWIHSFHNITGILQVSLSASSAI